MANQSQIEANRRNATKSTGPRSRSGKNRVSKNALRHGLSVPFQAGAAQARLEKLAVQIAGAGSNCITLELARAAAIAALDLARVRQVKAQLINGVSALGLIDPPPIFTSRKDELRYIKLALRTNARPSSRVDPPATLSSEAAACVAEAVRRALPELARLDRYEARAMNRRDQAIRAIMSSRSDIDVMTEDGVENKRNLK